MNTQHWHQEPYRISTNKKELDIEVIHRFLSSSYWADGIPRSLVEKSIRNSLCFGLFFEGRIKKTEQVGFARVISDYATFAYLGDVFVLPEHRGHGLGKWLMECVLDHPELQGLRRFSLGTKDAHGLYAQFGFKPVNPAENWMEIKVPNLYRAQVLNGPSDLVFQIHDPRMGT